MKDGPSEAPLEHALLGILAHRPLHGYDLYREMTRPSGLGLIWSVKQAQLYGMLARLERDGLIDAEVVVGGTRPARRVFHLTPAGRRAYRAWVTTPSQRRDFRLVFLAKLLFAREEGTDADLIERQRALCQGWLDDMRDRGSSAAGGSLDDLVYRYRIGQLEAMRAWLDTCAASPRAKIGAQRKRETS